VQEELSDMKDEDEDDDYLAINQKNIFICYRFTEREGSTGIGD